MLSDIQRWNSKYARKQPSTIVDPDGLLIRYADRVPHKGSALDVASGTGDNACYLAQLGLESFAVDGSTIALEHCRAKARAHNLSVMAFVADLDNYLLPAGRFDVVVVLRYLNRALLPALPLSLRPGGWLLYKTFNLNYLREKPVFRREYLVAPGELREAFKGLRLIESNDDPDNADIYSYWVGQRA